MSPKYVQKYLDEYVFRFDRRKAASVGAKLYRMIQFTAISSTVTLKNIVNPLLE